MSMQQRIQHKVDAGIGPQHFDLINESHMHSGPATESHFKLVVVSERFEGLSAVKRHQQLYALLADELRDGVHALALHLYTPAEWQSRQKAPDSPDCRGGSRHG
jgi:BolA family transcriptional regulator, general stress-responsive regulator